MKNNKRDSDGWRIPRDGTRSRLIYDRICAGFTPIEIHAEIGGSIATLRVLIWKIKHPLASNVYAEASHRRVRQREQEAA